MLTQLLHCPPPSTAIVLFTHWVQAVVEEQVMQSVRNYSHGSQRTVVFNVYALVMQDTQVVASVQIPQLGINSSHFWHIPTGLKT